MSQKKSKIGALSDPTPAAKQKPSLGGKTIQPAPKTPTPKPNK
jgi:hypothetical protein